MHIYSYPQQETLVSGVSSIRLLREQIETRGLRKAFVVTTKSLTGSPLLKSVLEALGNYHVGTFEGIRAHSPRQSVLDGSMAARNAGADVLVAVGGGSVLDASKGMLACLWWDLTSREDLDRLKERQAPGPIPAERGIRIFAVPTTLSGAEFGNLTGITDEERRIKDVYSHPLYMPQVVIQDPEATLTAAPSLLLSSGIRAVDHCVGLLCSSEPKSFSDALAREALRMLVRTLPAIATRPTDLTPRNDSQVGAWLAILGLSYGVPLGVSHAIGRVLGGAFGVPHGYTSCVLLPAALKWNAVADNGRQAELVSAVSPGFNGSAADAIGKLIASLDLPTRLRDVGVTREHFDEISLKTIEMIKYPSVSGNPRPISKPQDILEILDLAY
jgi:maleylacetate reductase